MNYEYRKFLVKNPSDVPSVPHYAVILYRQHTYYESTGYEKPGDYPTQSKIQISDYYAFKDFKDYQNLVIAFLSRPEKKDGEDMVAFRSTGRTTFKLKVEVSIEQEKDSDE